MTKSSTTTTALTIGIDLGDRTSHICVLDTAGEIAEESRIPTKPKALRLRFEGLAATRIALEVGGHSAWVSELLGELGHEVIVANARKLRMIFQNDSKSDRLDAEQLGRVARLDPKLLYPIIHRDRSARADLSVMRSRDALVTTRTRLVNHIHGVLKSFDYRVRKYAAPGFHRQVADQIPEELKPALQPLLDALAAIAERILCLDREIRRLLTKEYPETALLTQVGGVGPLTALCYVLTIESPQAASLLYKVVDGRYRKTSTALVTNIDFDAWSSYLGDQPLSMALLDRLVDHGIVLKLKGRSYRASRAKTVPKPDSEDGS